MQNLFKVSSVSLFTICVTSKKVLSGLRVKEKHFSTCLTPGVLAIKQIERPAEDRGQML